MKVLLKGGEKRLVSETFALKAGEETVRLGPPVALRELENCVKEQKKQTEPRETEIALQFPVHRCS